MNVFEAVKQSVTTRQAAEHYGIKARRNGMAVCPFHNDKNPSMKLDKPFHCFGCGADGDVIDFTARLFGYEWKKRYAPKLEDTEWNPLFVEALQRTSYVEYLLDIFLFGDTEEKEWIVREHGKKVRKLGERL